MPVNIPVARLAKIANPLKETPWCCIPFGRPEVTVALKRPDLYSLSPVPDDDFNFWPHAYRIAWFVRNGWKDAIEIDVGVPSLGCNPSWIVQDGNHGSGSV